MDNMSKRETSGIRFETKAIIVSVAVCVLVIGSLLLWAFVLRDTWEIDNRAGVQALCENIMQLSDAGDFQGVASKHNELVSLIGSHKIEDRKLCDTVAETYIVKEDAEAKLKERQRLAAARLKEALLKAEEMCKNIMRLAAANDFQSVIDEHNRLRALIGNQKIEDAQFSAMIAQADATSQNIKQECIEFPAIDLSWKRLPEGFNGHKFESIYDALEKKDRNRRRNSEFETTDAWQKRKDESLHSHLIGQLTTDSELAFIREWPLEGVFPNLASSYWEYDADRWMYYTSISLSGETEINSRGTAEYTVRSYIKSSSSRSTKELTITINMVPVEAKAVAHKLRLLYIVKPLLEYDPSDSGDGGAYTDRRYDFQYHHISVEIIQVWVVLEGSGEILKKITPVIGKSN